MSETAKLVMTYMKVIPIANYLVSVGFNELSLPLKRFAPDTIIVDIDNKQFEILNSADFVSRGKSGSLDQYVPFENGDEMLEYIKTLCPEPTQEEVVLESAKPEPEPEPAKKKTTRKKKTEPKND